MFPIIGSIVPVFLLIFLGAALRRSGFPGDGVWAPVERLTYYVLFPSLIVVTLAQAHLGELRILPMATALVVTLCAVSGLLVAARRQLALDGPAFTSVLQGTIRINTYICLAVAAAIWGTAGLTVAAIAVAIIVPTVNVISVVALTRFGADADGTPTGMARALSRNPLIIASVIGILFNITGLDLPPLIGPVLEILARAALPLGLLAVGAALSLSALRADARTILYTSCAKLLLAPAVAALLLWGFAVEGVTAAVALLFMASPTAPSSYILARELGGDSQLMAGLVTAQTIAAVVTIPIVLTLAT